MRTRSKLLLTGLAAAIVLAAAVGTATANKLSVSNRNIRAVFSNLTFSSGGFGEIICPVTMEGSFHSATIAKVRGALVGFISRATAALASCSGFGSAEVRQASLPWHVTYQGFTGTLPNIERILLNMAGTEFKLLNIPFCGESIYRGTAAGYATITGTSTTLNADNTVPIPRVSGGSLCPSEGFFEGTANVTLLGTTTNITVRLI